MTGLIQHAWIERVRLLTRTDARLTAALTYGSFTRGEGDEFSDIEFWLFVRDDAFATLDRVQWVSAMAPTLAVLDHLPHALTLALFEGYRRGEFHFAPASELHHVRSWVENGPFLAPETMLLVDHTGELHRHLQFLHDHPPRHGGRQQVQRIVDSYIHWTVQGAQVLRRGEYARALQTLSVLHTHLLQMARLVEHTTLHWPTPSRGAEVDLSDESYRRFATCTASVEPQALTGAYIQAWAWGKELAEVLLSRTGQAWPLALDVPFEALVSTTGAPETHVPPER